MITDALAHIDKARESLEAAKTVQEVNHVLGIAKASVVYARQMKGSREVILHANEIKIRAMRKLGQMLSNTERNRGGRPPKTDDAEASVSAPKLSEIGITTKESAQFQAIAELNDETFEGIIRAAEEESNLSVARVLKARKNEQRRQQRADSADFYPTPAWCVHRFLEACDLPGGLWLEPAVGDGAIIRAVDEVRDDVSWTAIDILPEDRIDDEYCGDYYCGDFISMDLDGERYGVIISNPPYKLAIDFVQKAIETAPIVAMLLRLNWLASADRNEWFHEHMPSEVYVLPDRPSFDAEGSDMTEYAWMVWRNGGGRYAKLSVLDTTPLEERKGR